MVLQTKAGAADWTQFQSKAYRELTQAIFATGTISHCENGSIVRSTQPKK
jgi:hypothetical protein